MNHQSAYVGHREVDIQVNSCIDALHVTAARTSIHPAKAFFLRMSGYEHPVLLNKLQAELGINREDAETLFTDLKMFLALCATTTRSLAPTAALDAPWHQFVLFTKDYERFCREYCGRFVHHLPEDPFARPSMSASAAQTLSLARRVFGEELSASWLCAQGAECTRCGTCQSPCQAPCGSDGDGD
jgi:hypothetical protein